MAVKRKINGALLSNGLVAAEITGAAVAMPTTITGTAVAAGESYPLVVVAATVAVDSDLLLSMSSLSK